MTSSGPTPMRTTAATDHRCHRARVAPSFSTIGPRRTAAPPPPLPPLPPRAHWPCWRARAAGSALATVWPAGADYLCICVLERVGSAHLAADAEDVQPATDTAPSTG